MSRSACLLITLATCATLCASPDALDLDFDSGTGPDGPITRTDLQADGKILIAGTFKIRMVRK
jgi:hypothetical protein